MRDKNACSICFQHIRTCFSFVCSFVFCHKNCPIDFVALPSAGLFFASKYVKSIELSDGSTEFLQHNPIATRDFSHF